MNDHRQRQHRITCGAILMAIAMVHQVVGVAIGFGLDPNVAFVGQPPLSAMLHDGIVGSVGLDPWRLAIAWFLLWGFVLGLLGLSVHQAERRGCPPTRKFAVLLGALCVVGIVLMPVSGFWLGLVPAVIAFRRADP
jgi:hypothetical protein